MGSAESGRTPASGQRVETNVNTLAITFFRMITCTRGIFTTFNIYFVHIYMGIWYTWWWDDHVEMILVDDALHSTAPYSHPTFTCITASLSDKRYAFIDKLMRACARDSEVASVFEPHRPYFHQTFYHFLTFYVFIWYKYSYWSCMECNYVEKDSRAE